MDISKISARDGLSEGHAAPAQRPDPQAPDQQAGSRERGLIPIASSQPESSLRRSTRPSPAFLAQLIATAQHAPQTRARGRIAPADAIAHYTSALSVSLSTQTWDWSV
jgi:hypothetical protein